MSSSIKIKAMPFENLSINDLKSELDSRNVDTNCLKNTIKDLQPVLKKQLCGAKRLPVLLLNNSSNDLEELELSQYEISLVECMHYVSLRWRVSVTFSHSYRTVCGSSTGPGVQHCTSCLCPEGHLVTM